MHTTQNNTGKRILTEPDRLFLSRTAPALAEYFIECGGLPLPEYADTEALRELLKAKLSSKKVLQEMLGREHFPNAEAVVCVGEGEAECLALAATLLCLSARLKNSPYASCPTALFLFSPPREDAELCRTLQRICAEAWKFSPRLSAAVIETLDDPILPAAELFFPENTHARELSLCGAIPISPEEGDAEELSLALEIEPAASLPALSERLRTYPGLPSLIAGWETLASMSGSLRFSRLSLASIGAAITDT